MFLGKSQHCVHAHSREDFFGIQKKTKLPKITRLQDLHVFAGFMRVLLRCFAGFSLVVSGAAMQTFLFWPLSHQA